TFEDKFVSTRRAIIKFCGEASNALYEAELTNWSRIVSGLNIPRAKILSILGQRVWLEIEYIDGSSAEATLLKCHNLQMANSLYERIIDLLACFQAKTYRNLLLQLEPQLPVSVISKWDSRP